jgi:hypothetical protein
MIKTSSFAILTAAALALPAGAPGNTLEDFRTQPDRRPAIRQSLGMREAQATGASEVTAVAGLSFTGAGRIPAAYRILSEQDPAYAYARFVRPVSVTVTTEVEAVGVRGSSFSTFPRHRIRLQLPTPLQPGATYHVIAQGAGRDVVTGARTAARFTYRGTNQATRYDTRIDPAVIGLRALEPVGNGIVMAEFGPGYAPEAGLDLEAWKVTLNGQPVPVTGLGRLSRVDTYLPEGWPFTAIPCHEIFLQLDRPFQQGDRLHLEVAEGVTAGLREANLRFDETATYCRSLKVNQVGYPVGAPVKNAYLGRWLGSFPEAVRPGGSDSGNGDSLETSFRNALQADMPATSPAEVSGPALAYATPPDFRLHDAATHQVVYTGSTRLVHRTGERTESVYQVDHSGENVYLIDFTAFRQSGTYYLSVAGAGRSTSFRIADDVYDDALQVAARGVLAQRCGIELHPPCVDWYREACHTEGVIPTTLLRAESESAAFRLLPERVDYQRLDDVQPDPALLALDRDPALLAYWRLDGDGRDASGNGRDLQLAAAPLTFTEVRELMPGQNQALGPTRGSDTPIGRVKGLTLRREEGMTLAAWVRMDGGIKFEGVVLGQTNESTHAARAQIAATWGVLRGFVGRKSEAGDIGRLSDGKWHHVALVAPGTTNEGTRFTMYVDGEARANALAGAVEALPDDEFVVLGLRGEQAADKYVDDVRVYRRALSAKEVHTLSQRWGERALALPIHGGHHDAGDYNPRSHIEVAQILMNAYEMAPRKFSDGQLCVPEQANGVPDVLDEAAWALQLWLGLQEADGGVRGGTESNGDPNFVQTVELDTLGDYAFAPDPGSSFEFAGTLAQAARIWKSLGQLDKAANFLQRAQRAYRWAMAHPLQKADSAEQAAKLYFSPKAYAAAELLHTTGERAYQQDFLQAAVWATRPEADLNKHRLYDQSRAAWAYAKCPANCVDTQIQAAVRSAIVREADLFIQHCSTMAYRFIRHPWAPISWGTGAYQNWLDSTLWAYHITGDSKYLAWILHTCDNTLGANPLGLSFITGLGQRSIHAPLHNSRYGYQGEAVAGLQSQGPNQRGEGYRVPETAYPRLQEDFASLYTFVDAHYAIAMNEGTVVPQARTMAVFGLLLPDPDTSHKP